MSTIKSFFLLICCLGPFIFLQAQNKTYQEIKLMLNGDSTEFNRELKSTILLDHVHPIDIYLKINDDDEVIGTAVYGDGSHIEMLEGFFYKYSLRLESISSKDEFTGLWTADNASGELENWVWINANGTKGYNLVPSNSEKFIPITYSYSDKKNRSFINYTNDGGNEEINITNFEQLSQEADIKKSVLNDCRECTIRQNDGQDFVLCVSHTKKGKLTRGGKQHKLKLAETLNYYCHREINPYTLTDICIPKLGIPVFDDRLKKLLQEVFYQSPCDEQSFDPQFHWNNLKKVSTKIHYHDKSLLSFRLRMVSSCHNNEKLLYFNFDKENKKWIGRREITKKIGRYSSSIKNEGDLYFLMGHSGIEIHREYDIMLGSQPFILTYDSMELKNYKEFLK